MPSGQNDPPLLAGGNARPGAAEVAAAAQAHFDESQRLAIAANQVDFATANAEIAFNNA